MRAAHCGRLHGGTGRDIGVLTRDNSTAEAVFDALTGAGIPVEIVGLSGLLRLPEVAEIVAMLELLHDVTANAAVLTLLTGPRWAIGPRDLRLLKERAAELAGRRGRTESASIGDQLTEIADGIDPAELPALSDALEEPGDAAYSEEALERFALLAGELRMLRAYAGEPILDVVRRIVDTTGIDVELASAVSPAAAARRDNLDLFLKAVAEFQAIDGDVTLPALLAYLTAEDDQGNGLDIATPTEADSVKLLTVHRAKGLEWACRLRRGRVRDALPVQPVAHPVDLVPLGAPGAAARRRGGPAPAEVAGTSRRSMPTARDTRAHDRTEELRLGYVSFTRAAHRADGVVVPLEPDGRRPSAPSEYQRVLADLPAECEVDRTWLDKPEKGAANPYAGRTRPRPGP